MSPSVTVVNSTNRGSFSITAFDSESKVSGSPLQKLCAGCQNFTCLPASLNTTSLKIWQVRSCIFLGKGSIQMPCQPFSSSAFVFDQTVPSPDPTSTKNPSFTPGNTASDAHLSWPNSE